MNLFALSGLLTGISSLAFGYFVYWKGAHRPLNRLWFIFTMSVAVWGFGGMWIALAPDTEPGLMGLASVVCLRRRMDSNFLPPLRACVL